MERPTGEHSSTRFVFQIFFQKSIQKKGVLLYLGGLQYGHSARFIYARAIARYHAPYLRSIDRDSSAETFTEGALQLFSS